MDSNMMKELSGNVMDQMWGWIFTAASGRTFGALIILGIFYKVFEMLLLGTIDKLRKPQKRRRRK
ncbi:hypothetical protein FHL05_03700 [Lactobacillus halodurans]|nr:hypothetical protein [Companilactobacillus halodurans]